MPCHDIRHGAQKKLAYRVRERLVRVIKAKKNAKLELKIPFTTRKDPFIGRGGLDRPEPISKLSRVRSLTMGLKSALVLPAFQNNMIESAEAAASFKCDFDARYASGEILAAGAGR